MARRKYGNIKTGRNDSIKEVARGLDLRMLEKVGEIRGLESKPKYILIPTQRDAHGKLIERQVTYTADFSYWADDELVVEDVKSKQTKRGKKKFSTKTEAYVLRRKLMLWVHGIRVTEVE